MIDEQRRFRIVPLSKQYVEGAVEMHMLAFEGYFLSFLGRGFLRELYTQAAKHEQSVSFVAVDSDNKVAGATFGLIDSKIFYKDIIKHRWGVFAFKSLWAAIKRPSIIPRLFRALRHEGNIPPCNLKPLAAIHSLAVRPDVRAIGIAIALMRRSCEEFSKRRINGVFLTTDAENNDRVRGFYVSLGWDMLGYYTTPEGRKMCWYLWQEPSTRKELSEIKGAE